MASSSATPLFRSEVLSARSAQYLGGIRIGNPPGATAVAWLAGGLVALLFAFAAWGEVTRKVRVAGLLMPEAGTLQLSAPVAGVLAERRVAEGDLVQAGQALFVLATDRTSPQGALADLVHSSLQHRRTALEAEVAARRLQFEQRQEALRSRLRALANDRRQAETEVALFERRVELASRTVERYRQLALEGFVAELQVQARQDELMELQARREAAGRSAAAVSRDAQAAQAELSAALAQWQAEQAQLARSQAMLEQESTENQARKTLVVTAPQAGSITALHLPLGAGVQPGQTLATLVPGGTSPGDQLQAHLYAPSRAAGFVRAGQEVWLRYAAFPYQKFGMARATVDSISRTPVNPQDLPMGQATALLHAAQSQEPLYRIVLRLQSQAVKAYGQAHPLKPGMTVDADVMQERRRIWEWALAPLRALASTANLESISERAAPSTP